MAHINYLAEKDFPYFNTINSSVVIEASNKSHLPTASTTHVEPVVTDDFNNSYASENLWLGWYAPNKYLEKIIEVGIAPPAQPKIGYQPHKINNTFFTNIIALIVC